MPHGSRSVTCHPAEVTFPPFQCVLCAGTVSHRRLLARLPGKTISQNGRYLFIIQCFVFVFIYVNAVQQGDVTAYCYVSCMPLFCSLCQQIRQRIGVSAGKLVNK